MHGWVSVTAVNAVMGCSGFVLLLLWHGLFSFAAVLSDDGSHGGYPGVYLRDVIEA